MILDNSVELQIDYAVVGFIKQYEIQLRRCGKVVIKITLHLQIRFIIEDYKND